MSTLKPSTVQDLQALRTRLAADLAAVDALLRRMRSAAAPPPPPETTAPHRRRNRRLQAVASTRATARVVRETIARLFTQTPNLSLSTAEVEEQIRQGLGPEHQLYPSTVRIALTHLHWVGMLALVNGRTLASGAITGGRGSLWTAGHLPPAELDPSHPPTRPTNGESL